MVSNAGAPSSIGVSLVLWHSDPSDVRRLVRSLEGQGIGGFALEVLVNEDPDGRAEAEIRHVLSDVSSDVRLGLRSSAVNHGFAGGHNLLLEALASAGADAFLVVNPDVTLGDGCLRALFSSDVPADVLLGPLLLAADPRTLEPEGTIDSAGIRWTWDGRHLDARQGEAALELPDRPYEVAGVSGACLYVTRAAWEGLRSACGEFFDSDFLAYREDAELGLRASRLGWASYVVPAARALHVRSLRGTGRTGVSEHVLRLGVRNRFLIAFKHGSARPGAWFGAPLRDVVVIAGVLLAERSSLRGLVEAWRLRRVMRAKGRRIRIAAAGPRPARGDARTLGAVS